MRRSVLIAAVLFLMVVGAGVAPAAAQSFVGPSDGGGWSGTLSGSTLTYNGQTYAVVNGRVYFPDCTNYGVAPNGWLFAGAATPNCTPFGSAPAFVGPLAGGGYSGTVSGNVFTYNGQAYVITAGRVSFPDCTNFFVAPNGWLFGGQLTANCTPSSGSGSGSPAVPTITWPAPAPVTIGTLLSATQLNATSGGAAGTFAYTPPAGTAMNTVGVHPLSVTFTPTDTSTYTTATQTVQLQVNATAFVGPSGGGGYQGTLSGSIFTYNGQTFPMTGSRVYFPDCTNYLVAPNGWLFAPLATANCAPGGLITPAIAWPVPASVSLGMALSATQLNATSGGVAGTFVYTPVSGTVMNTAGPQVLRVDFMPTDTATYASATASVTLQVNGPNPPPPAFVGPLDGGGYAGTLNGAVFTYNGQVYPVVNARVYFPDCTTYLVAPNGMLFAPTAPACKTTPAITWPAPASLVYGTALGATQLNATAGGVAGSFTYVPASGAILPVGTHALSVVFVPADLTTYNPVTAGNSIVVTKATPVIAWPTPAPVAYGTVLSATQLNATSGGVAGGFAYTPAAGTTPLVGSHTLSVTFTPADAANYAPATASVALVVTPGAPPLTWPAPAAIAYGTTLSGAQLNATAPVPGTFAYTPPAGTLLEPGSHSLSVTFSPSDSVNYLAASSSVAITVNKATPAITWPNPADIIQGAALTATQLNASASAAGAPSLPGAFTYLPPAGTVMNAIGGQTLSVTFAPADSTRYTSASGTATLKVVFANPSNGGPTTGALSGLLLTYNGAQFTVRSDGRVTFPDCSDYLVAPGGAAFYDPQTASNCTPYSSVTPGAITGGGTGPASETDGTAGVTKTVTYSPALANPDLAYDAASGRYLMVFYAAGVLRGVLLDRDGNAVSAQFIIDYGSIFSPSVAASGTGRFLATYTVNEDGIFRRRVKLIDAAGAVTPAVNGLLSTGLIVAESSSGYLTERAGVAWNGTLNYFQVAWPDAVGGGIGQIGTYVTGVRLDGTMTAKALVADPFLCGGGEYLKHTLPEIAVAADGSALVVGYRDSTSSACIPYGGLWFRTLSSAGTPTGATGVVQGANDRDLHREHRIAYNSVLNTYQVVWSRSGSILSSVYGQRFDGSGARLGSAYLVMGPLAYPGSNGALGQIGMAYDPVADQFEIAVRVNDTGNGLSPVSRFRLRSDGTPKTMTPVRVESGAVNPWPVVVADGTGRFMIMYRLSYETRIAFTPILP